ncbi:uncharacterized protein LOC110862921 [Folsomia candida]|uniref:Pro-Pol polyprotein n=1 Tax=Folsomia candida TaxID=158441 RepID=A0A226CVK9_FOLCA|nr:uncharacterized protein LOC110862921 [Folsomia candida]OXA36644.1 Pro-Pol polyprotein [Folsomia candida]
MDRLTRRRAPLRATITKTVNDIDEELEKDPPDQEVLNLKLNKLGRLLTEVGDLDQKVKDAMLDADCTDAEYEAEINVIQDYEDKIHATRFKVEKVLRPGGKTPSPPASFYSVESEGHQKKTFKLPKIQLKKFSGDLKEWLGWWSQFSKIDEDEELHASDKFQYLLQCMVTGSRARGLVESFPMTAENYPKAIIALKERFGKEKLLQQVYVRELLRLVIATAKSKEKIVLSELYDKVETQLRALESLGIKPEHTTLFLFPMVESCLPEETLTTWHHSPLRKEDGSKLVPPKNELHFLMEFLREEVENEATMRLVRAGFETTAIHESSGKEKKKNGSKAEVAKSKNNEGSIPTAAGLFAGQKSYTCIFCSKSHPSPDCFKAQNMNLQDKNELIEVKKACSICLGTGHRSNSCRTPVKCILCSRKHQTVMCPEIWSLRKTGHKTPEAESPTTMNGMAMNSHACSGDVLLQTLMVRLYNEGGGYKVARLVFDNGSQGTSIRVKSAQDLKLKPIGESWSRKVLYGGQVTDMPSHRYEPEICGQLSRVPKGPWIQELAAMKIHLSDFKSENAEIEILVGSDYYGQLVTGRVVQLKCGLTAIESVLGWTLCGRVPGETNVAAVVLSTALMSCQTSVSELWNLETLGIRDPAQVKSKTEREEATRQHFQETVSRGEDGRYSVRLPWVNGPPSIPDNKSIAMRRLESTTKKLQEAGKFQDYDQIFKEWLREGFVEKLHVYEEDEEGTHYLPHHAVIKPQSLTTPVRPVFDASCKTGRNPSLNDCLEKGPNELELIPSIILRFREKKIGVISDIRKAFQMIGVHESDRNFLRFLWWEDVAVKKVQVFRHMRVVFGGNCSPFLLGAVLSLHLGAADLPQRIRDIAQKLLRSMYVDNSVTSVDSIEEYEEFKTTSIQLLSEAKMDLRQWECGSAEGSGIGPAGCGLVTGGDHTPQEMTTVLGLKWNKCLDVLMVEVPKVDLPELITKRVILSQVQQIFDPMGFLSPATLVPKMLLQKTWETKMKWDEELSVNLKKEFLAWWNQASDLEQIHIPRYAIRSTHDNLQLHTFCDASQNAYAAAVFIRVETEDEVFIQLLQAKSRVAPINKVTTPRLELLGCTIATRLTSAVKKALAFEDIPTFYWSDSTTALAWIRRNDEWGTFVGNRVKEICSLSCVEEWRHVPGKLNPADLPSRGCSPSELLDSRWWEGPGWLKSPDDEWPLQASEANEEQIMSEAKKKSIQMNAVDTLKSLWYVRYSSFTKNVRLVALIIRFANKLRKKSTEKGELKRCELESAEEKLFILVQQETFPTTRVPEDVIAGLRVFRDEDSTLLHVKTKLTHRNDDTNIFRQPVLLPNSHPLVDQLIREEHIYNAHAGAQFLMGRLRERCWIIQGRRAVRKIIKSCVICRRFTTKAPILQQAPLPEDRVKNARVFQTTGIDLAGPLYLKDGSKVWFVIFTCAVYRAIHLELVSASSTDAFLLALFRFISRRGRPSVIYSDNGTNFVGADNLFKKMDWKKIESATRVSRITWKFNPPSAAWWGGFWERLIRSVKDLLKRMLGHRKLDYEQLLTCLYEAEAVVNSRPLTLVTEDQDDLIPLTPAMFIQDIAEINCPEVENLTGMGLNRKYKQMKILHVELRNRFRKEYFGQLVQRGKHHRSVSFQVGDVVLIGDDNKKRIEWPMGRIIQLYPGKDGQVRVARVKTTTNEFLRPLQRLFPLEVSSPTEVPSVPKVVMEKAVRKKKEKVKFEEKEVITRAGRRVKMPTRLGVDDTERH